MSDDTTRATHHREAATILWRLWGDPEDCESCALIAEAPCEVHRDRALAQWLERDAALFPMPIRAAAPEP